MQALAGMAVSAFHAALSEMDITDKVFILTHVFIADTAAMTRGAGAGHGRCLLEDMTIQQTTAHIIRLGDMALAAGCMAGTAMVIEHLSQRFFVIRHLGSDIKGFPIA